MSEAAAPVTVTRDGAIARVTLDRPQLHNAFDEALIAGLAKTFQELALDEAALNPSFKKRLNAALAGIGGGAAFTSRGVPCRMVAIVPWASAAPAASPSPSASVCARATGCSSARR